MPFSLVVFWWPVFHWALFSRHFSLDTFHFALFCWVIYTGSFPPGMSLKEIRHSSSCKFILGTSLHAFWFGVFHRVFSLETLHWALFIVHFSLFIFHEAHLIRQCSLGICYQVLFRAHLISKCSFVTLYQALFTRKSP